MIRIIRGWRHKANTLLSTFLFCSTAFTGNNGHRLETGCSKTRKEQRGGADEWQTAGKSWAKQSWRKNFRLFFFFFFKSGLENVQREWIPDERARREEKLTYLSSLDSDPLSVGCYLRVDRFPYRRICSCWWQRKANICRNDLPDFNGNSSQNSCRFYAADCWKVCKFSLTQFLEGFIGNINKHLWLSDCNHHVRMNQSAGII